MDLMRLHDIGSLSDDSAPFAISPDGTRIAVAVREAVVEANTYCTRIKIIDLQSLKTHEAAAIDGGVILERGDVAEKLANFGSGVMRALIPVWGPDGKTLAYLGREPINGTPAAGDRTRT